MTYAKDTNVSVEKSKAEIESILRRYGATGFSSAWIEKDGIEAAQIQFHARGSTVRFQLVLPNKNDTRFAYTPSRRNPRSPDERMKAWEQACRSKWRSLALAIKAKLEAVDAGITIFEEEFLAHIVLPSGERVGRWLIPQLEAARVSGEMPLGIAFTPESEKP